MKKKALRKDFYMEVRKTLNRFLSIMLIVALGVAFYAGIQSAAPDMRYSGDAYFDDNKLMDLKVVGTLGLTEDDVSALSEIDHIEKAEPGYMTDVFCGSESQSVLHVESISPTLNQLTAEEGRLPEKSGECFVDSEFLEEEGYQVGDEIELSLEDEEDYLLKTHTFTIVGAGSSPLYIAFSRGNTTLGNGEIGGVAYVLPEDFDSDVYTQIYMKVSGAENLTAYTDAYDTLIERVMQDVESIADGRCEIRYKEVREEADQKIADAEEELEDGRKKGKKELADAKKELEDGETQLADAKKQLKEAKQEITDSEQELTDGEKEIEENKKTLDEKEEELKEAKQELADGWQELTAAKEEFNAQAETFYDSYEPAMEEIEAGEEALSAAKEELAAGQEEYDAGLEQYQKGLAQYKKGEKEYSAGKKTLEEQEKTWTSKKKELTRQKKELEENQSTLTAALSNLNNQKQSLEDQLNSQQGSQDTLQEELDAVNQQITEYSTQLSTVEAGITQVEAGITQGDSQIAQAKETLAQSRTQLDASKKQLAATKTQLKAAKAELDSGEKEIEENEAKLTESKQQLLDGKEQIESARDTLTANEEKLNTSQAQLTQGEQQISDGREQITAAEEEIKEGKQSLKEAKEEVSDGEKEIKKNAAKLKKAKKEYQDGVKDFKKEIADAEQELADAKQDLADLEEPEWTVSDRSDLQDNIGYGENADRMKNIGQVFPALFFLVAALISLTTMTRMVEEERTQIGTLKALGYSKVSIAAKYIGYALAATLMGSGIGIAFGEKFLPYVIVTAYKIMYRHMTNIVLPYNIKFALIATGAALLSTIGATLVACWRALADAPAVLMRPPAPKKGKRVLLEHIPVLWGRLSFSWKSTVRNLFRYKKRFFMTIFGISGCMALMIVGFGLRDSIMDIANLQFEELQQYDMMTILNEDASDAETEELTEKIRKDARIAESTRAMMQKESVYVENKYWDIYVTVPEDVESFKEFVSFRDRTDHEETYELTDEGAILTEKIANALDVKVGDSIVVEDEDHNKAEVPIAAVTENYLSHYIYLTPALYRQCFGEEPEFNNILCRAAEEDSEQLTLLGEEILDQEAALSISYTSSLMEQMNDMLSALDSVMYVLIISAGLLAFVVLYNLNNININERKRELATIKVLGFYDKEVDAYVYRENILLTVIGIFTGIVLGILLHRFTIVTVEIDSCMFGRNINLPSFLIASVFTAIFSTLVNLGMHFKLKKIDMVESLKSVE